MTQQCEHFAEIHDVTPRTDGCEDCIAIGSTWTQLRVCLTCGRVGADPPTRAELDAARAELRSPVPDRS